MFFKVLQINQLIELCSRKCRWHLVTLCFCFANQVPLKRQGLWWGWQFAAYGSSGMWGCGFEQHQVNKKQQHRMHWLRAEAACVDGGQGELLAIPAAIYSNWSKSRCFYLPFQSGSTENRGFIPPTPSNMKVSLLLCPFTLISVQYLALYGA